MDMNMKNDAIIDDLDDNAEKDCPVCTFKNPSHYATCDMCNSPL